MATYTKIKTGWLCQVRKLGFPSVSKTFKTKQEAQAWGTSVENEIELTRSTGYSNLTLKQAISRYIKEVCPHKKGKANEVQRLSNVKLLPFAELSIQKITQAHVAKYRDDRLKLVSGSTVTRDLATLSHVFTIARKEWGIKLDNPVSLIRKPKVNQARTRRLNQGEYETLLKHSNFDIRHFIIIAIESAMRRSEICSITSKMISGNIVRLSETKNGTARLVPLSPLALTSVNELLDVKTGKLCRYRPNYYSEQFKALCDGLGIDDLRLHDLRHEATTRLFEKGLSIMEVSTITGHKTAAMVERYTQLNVAVIAAKL